MADIELVVKLDQKTLQDLYDSRYVSPHIKEVFRSATRLPKGHGRLVDESKITKCGWNFIDHHIKADAPTIIEADTESEE